MATILVLALIVLLAVLAPRYGADSRNLTDHAWEQRPDLTAPTVLPPVQRSVQDGADLTAVR